MTGSITYPGAVAPQRERFITSCGLRVHVCEWGDAAAEPLVLTHGFFDHARAFDLLAPLLAERYRVIAWDSRGHGDSDWADNYSWSVDVMDHVNLLRDTGPALLVGHSRGGGLAADVTALYPEGVRRLVLLDGFGPPPEGVKMEQGRDWRPERTPPEELETLLDWRHKTGEAKGFRPRATLDELARGRKTQNPRLSLDWLRYFAQHGAKAVPGGFTWKVDPLAARGFGPFTPSWVDETMKCLPVPVLAVEPGEADVWALPEPWRSERLALAPKLTRCTVEDSGHFLAVEQPVAVARAVLDFFADAV